MRRRHVKHKEHQRLRFEISVKYLFFFKGSFINDVFYFQDDFIFAFKINYNFMTIKKIHFF